MRAHHLVTFLVAALFAGASGAAECPGSLLGELTEGPVQSLALHAGHLYIGSGATLLTYSLADPSNPVRTSAVRLHGLVLDITPSAGHLYVAARDFGVEILELLDPAHPAPLSRLRLPERTASVAVSGGRAYAVGLTSLRILDVSSPAAPRELGAWIDPGRHLYSVEVSGSHAFVTDYGSASEGLLSIDVSDPSAPMLAGHLGTSIHYTTGIAVTGSTAYLAAGGFGLGLTVVDISNPRNPIGVGAVDLGYVTDVVVAGDRAFVASDTGLRVLDVTNPTQPVQIGALPGPWSERVAATTGLVALGSGQWGDAAELVDVTNPSTPVSLWSLDTPDAAIDVAIDGTSALLASGSEGLRVVDLSSPANPVEIGSLGFGPDSYVDGVAAAAGRAYLAASRAYPDDDVLHIVDVTNPADPAELSVLNLPSDDIVEMAVAGSRLNVVTLGGLPEVSGLHIVDVSDPAAPVVVGSYWSSPLVFFGELAVNGTTVVLRTALDVRVLDTTDPAAPTLVSTIDVPNVVAIAMKGSRLALTARLGPVSHRLDLVDLSDPAAPVMLGTRRLTTSGPAGPLTMTSTWVVINDSWGSVLLFDITDPSHPFKVGSSNPPGSGSDVAMVGDLVVSGNGDAGISLLSASGMAACWIFSDGFETGDTSFWSVAEP